MDAMSFLFEMSSLHAPLKSGFILSMEGNYDFNGMSEVTRNSF